MRASKKEDESTTVDEIRMFEDLAGDLPGQQSVQSGTVRPNNTRYNTMYVTFSAQHLAIRKPIMALLISAGALIGDVTIVPSKNLHQSLSTSGGNRRSTQPQSANYRSACTK